MKTASKTVKVVSVKKSLSNAQLKKAKMLFTEYWLTIQHMQQVIARMGKAKTALAVKRHENKFTRLNRGIESIKSQFSEIVGVKFSN
jgi:hypothetical protein